MKRQHIVEEIRQALGGTATTHAAQLALEAVLLSIKEGLQQDGMVKIAGFGTFRVHEQAARMGHHPLTADPCPIPAQRTVKFKASPQQYSAPHS